MPCMGKGGCKRSNRASIISDRLMAKLCRGAKSHLVGFASWPLACGFRVSDFKVRLAARSPDCGGYNPSG